MSSKAKKQAIEDVKFLFNKVGGGFHPDNKISEYVRMNNNNNEPAFNQEECTKYQKMLDEAWEVLGEEIYNISLMSMNQFLKDEDNVLDLSNLSFKETKLHDRIDYEFFLGDVSIGFLHYEPYKACGGCIRYPHLDEPDHDENMELQSSCETLVMAINHEQDHNYYESYQPLIRAMSKKFKYKTDKDAAQKMKDRLNELGHKISLTHCYEALARVEGYKTRNHWLGDLKKNRPKINSSKVETGLDLLNVLLSMSEEELKQNIEVHNHFYGEWSSDVQVEYNKDHCIIDISVDCFRQDKVKK